VQDPQGRVWVATQKGVAWFAGGRFHPLEGQGGLGTGTDGLLFIGPKGRKAWRTAGGVPLCREEEAVIRFEVQDQGPGLTPEGLDLVFGAYARLSAQPTGGEASVGLGLSIVKKLTEGMGARSAWTASPDWALRSGSGCPGPRCPRGNNANLDRAAGAFEPRRTRR